MQKFSDYLTEKSNVPGINDNGLGIYIVEALNSVTQFHIWHLLSISGQKHTALGEFYEGLRGALDELAEMFISTGGTLVGTDISVASCY